MKLRGDRSGKALKGAACAFLAACAVAALFVLQAGSLSPRRAVSKPVKVYSARSDAAKTRRPPAPRADYFRASAAQAQNFLPVEIPSVSASAFSIPAVCAVAPAPRGADFSAALFGAPEESNFSAEIFSVDMLDKIPRRLNSVMPAYPRQMLRRGVEGEVSLSVVIDQTGALSVEGVVSATNDFFRDSAVEAARKFVYEPPTRNGKPVRARFVLPIPFKISR